MLVSKVVQKENSSDPSQLYLWVHLNLFCYPPLLLESQDGDVGEIIGRCTEIF